MGMGKVRGWAWGKVKNRGTGKNLMKKFSLIFTFMYIFTLFIFYIFANCERKTSVGQSTSIKQKFKQTFSNTDGEKSKVQKLSQIG